MKSLFAAGLLATASVAAFAAPTWAQTVCDKSCQETGPSYKAPTTTNPGPEIGPSYTAPTTPTVDPKDSEEQTGKAPTPAPAGPAAAG